MKRFAMFVMLGLMSAMIVAGYRDVSGATDMNMSCCENGKAQKGGEHAMEMKCPMSVEGASVLVRNIPGGVGIEITASDTRAIQAIRERAQEHMACRTDKNSEPQSENCEDMDHMGGR